MEISTVLLQNYKPQLWIRKKLATKRNRRFRRLSLISSESRKHERVDKRPVPGAFQHKFVFEIIENRLDERAFTQEDFLFGGHAFKNVESIYAISLSVKPGILVDFLGFCLRKSRKSSHRIETIY